VDDGEDELMDAVRAWSRIKGHNRLMKLMNEPDSDDNEEINDAIENPSASDDSQAIIKHRRNLDIKQ
jgi:hypothetical protein